jgi:hypothetical protein
MSELRDFASICGIELEGASRREQLIRSIMLRLLSLSSKESEEKLSAPVSQKRDFGAEYERWVDIILRKS